MGDPPLDEGAWELITASLVAFVILKVTGVPTLFKAGWPGSGRPTDPAGAFLT